MENQAGGGPGIAPAGNKSSSPHKERQMARASSAARKQPKGDDLEVYEIPLEQIRPAPWNPAARLNSDSVETLSKSIAQHGQQTPALLRNVEADAPVLYELVYGHRRFAALKFLAEKDPETQRSLKAFVRSLSEEEAIALSGTENLQREDFSDYEMAVFFKKAAEAYGTQAAIALSEKFNIGHKYIRKLMAFLDLPMRAVMLWRQGIWQFGHMEQLLRIGDIKETVALLESLGPVSGGRLEQVTVETLRSRINNRSVLLDKGLFDKQDCKSCRQNSSCQLRLFGGIEGDAKCLNSACFKGKQQAWFDINWINSEDNKFETRRALITAQWTEGTGGFDLWNYPECKAPERCLTCDSFTTTIGIEGTIRHSTCCFGDEKCYKHTLSEYRKATRIAQFSQDSEGSSDAEQPTEESPRVEWHGEHFRQQFYKTEIPRVMARMLPIDPRRLQIALASYIYQTGFLRDWFFEQTNCEKPDRKYGITKFSDYLLVTQRLAPARIESLLSDASVLCAFDKGYGFQYTNEDRQALAEFIGVSFRDFSVSEEWFQKKTKAELLNFIVKESGLIHEEGFQNAMKQAGFATAEKLATAKKVTLVDIIQHCGVDLHGRVPKEIENKPVLEA